MSNSLQYGIIALIDNFGRVGVGANDGPDGLLSLTIETYVPPNEDPFEAVGFELLLRTDIYTLKQDDNIELVCKGLDSTPKHGVIRNASMYVYHLKGKMTLKIKTPTKNIIEFIPFMEIKKRFLNKEISLSACGQKMLSFLEQKRYGVLKDLNI